MKTICLRFSDAYALEEGTIKLHQETINKFGFVWYGKRGCKISKEVFGELLRNGPIDILLVKSGSNERYWATVVDYFFEEKEEHPTYYKNESSFMKTWIKMTNIKLAQPDVLKYCSVSSTGTPLMSIIKRSMSAYFIINFECDN